MSRTLFGGTMCNKFYKTQIPVLHLAMCGDRKVAYGAFLGYLMWARSLTGESKTIMLKSARKSYELYKAIKVRQEESTDIIDYVALKEAA
jgi:hypothetical protein